MTEGALGSIAGFTVERFSTLDSTQNVVRTRLSEGRSDHVVVAGEQTQGRGRRGRIWSSPPGNLYASIGFGARPPARQIGMHALLAGVAVRDTLVAMVPDQHRVTLKWPNDLLIGGAKCAGLLLETERGAGSPDVILGVGLNVATKPETARYPVTCLADLCPTPVSVAPILSGLLADLRRRLDQVDNRGWRSIREAWLEGADRLGQPVSLDLGTGIVTGLFTGLADDGAMVLETSRGRQTVHAGEVLRVEPRSAA
ncbi:MAG: biotin--[acetyl-CoA-carboxylase] ligase [Geminicoccaceae bacterium]